MQRAETRDDVLQHVRKALQELARGTQADLRAEPPQTGEIGEPLEDGDDHHWLVTTGLWRARPDPALDSQHLGSLARMATEALTRVRMRQVVTKLAESDPLTGLCNRAVFLQRVDDALAQCRSGRSCHRWPCCSAISTGSRGSTTGSGTLPVTSCWSTSPGRWSEPWGPEGLVARLGGDEFAVLLRPLPAGADVDERAGSVLAAVERRFEYDGRSVLVSTSVGAAFSEGRHTADQLLRNADLAMYAAKFAGKNRARTYHPAIGRARVETLELAEALNEALTRRELTVAYQPIVNVASGRIMGVEALARWRHQGRDVPPDTFIALAEEHGLIDDLGELVLEVVAGDAAALSASSDHQIAVGVNVSALQLHTPRLVAAVRRARELMGSAALVLELTERQMIGEDANVLRALDTLKSDDVRLALDDFGVGFSSIGYLQRLAVRILKIDRQFSAGIDTDERDMRLLLSMIDMGRAMELDVVIEGLERPEQLSALMPHLDGFADHVFLQGYLLGRPMALPEVLEHIERSRAQAEVLTS
jgi:EAL domain-containing protein (putative c-di-GMP-specific phosphodiesterase class I)/GGDEF domain-containing protein